MKIVTIHAILRQTGQLTTIPRAIFQPLLLTHHYATSLSAKMEMLVVVLLLQVVFFVINAIGGKSINELVRSSPATS